MNTLMAKGAAAVTQFFGILARLINYIDLKNAESARVQRRMQEQKDEFYRQYGSRFKGFR